MELLHSIILGIVEGITEFLPISSTGHMILTGYLLKLPKTPVLDAFEVFIQLGAILAVVVLYRERFVRLMPFNRTSGFSGWRGLGMLAMTSLPILGLGKLLEPLIKAQLFTPLVVTWALALGGVVLILVERVRFRHDVRSVDHIGWRKALTVGLFQCLALCPGVSRAASTMIGGMCVGMDRTVAAEYSFLAAVPVMLIVCLKELVEIWNTLSVNDISAFALGFVIAFISALLAVKSLILFLQKSSFIPFGFYRLIVAAVFFLLLSQHPLS